MKDEMKVTEEFLKIMQENLLFQKYQFVSSHETETDIVLTIKRKSSHELEE